MDLCTEIDAAPPKADAPRVLDRVTVHAHPVALTPCIPFKVDKSAKSAFVLSQKRSNGKKYITVAGKREYPDGKGFKKRSTQQWPRTRNDRLRPVSLHRWIAFAMHGAPPSASYDAAHVCGNDACIAGAHLQWQKHSLNMKDVVFHKELQPVYTLRTTRHYARLPYGA